MTPIRTLLVANRGEIACRVLRTARDMGIRTVAVFSDADEDAPHVGQADVAVRLPGVSATDTYLRGDLVVAAARRTGADAVHPGYGFLSENADFARQVADAGLVFVGPSPEVIDAMGSKIRAKELMAAAGVPVLPGATVLPGAPVLPGATVGGGATDGGEESLPAGAAAVGYPLLVKASAGGGGRGMRVVATAAELAGAVAAARREAAAAFGDDTLFLERYLVDPRHVEVQIFGDAHGTVVSLGERECSVQRRFQKVLEEAPSPAVGAELRARLDAAAVAAGRALGYVGAGTVEFVLDQDGDFHFLEVNTRLQVEHPVTELVTGLDLVRLQLLVAAGEPLPPEALEPRRQGHAIEVRLYAEDPDADFLPTSGRLRSFSLPSTVSTTPVTGRGSTVRVDAGVAAGQLVTTHYDALLAKVIAHAPTRAEAAATLAGALRRSRIHGLRTNRDLLAAVLSEPEFLAGGTDTGYLDRHPPAQLTATPVGSRDEAAAAAVLALRAHRARHAVVQPGVTPGWRNVVSADPLVRLATDDGGVLAVRYRVDADRVAVRVDDRPLDALARVVAVGPRQYQVALEHDGVRATSLVDVDLPHLDVGAATGSVDLLLVDPLPAPAAARAAGSLVAPMPGVVIRTEVQPGQPVHLDQPLLVLEAMKMEHTVRAPADGRLAALLVQVGDQVEVGQPLAVLAAADAEEAAS